MSLLRRRFSPAAALDGSTPGMDPLSTGSLVQRFKLEVGAFADPVTRTAARLRALLPGRSRKPLVLELPGKTLVFSSPAEFEFGLASRIEFPVRKAARLVDRPVDYLEEMARKLRAVEKRFAGVFVHSLEHPDRIGRLLASLGGGLFSRDHDWRDIAEALNRHGRAYDEYKHVALVKYMQYLASRQRVLRSIYLEKAEPAPSGSDPQAGPGPDLHAPAGPEPEANAAGRHDPAAVPGKETALFDLEEPAPGPEPDDGDGDDQRDLKAIPRGEPLCVRFAGERELDLRLASHRFKLFPGRRFCLVDEASGLSYLLREGRNVVGRHSGNEVVVDPAYLGVSRKHLIIEPVAENAALLTDISSHGTFISPHYV